MVIRSEINIRILLFSVILLFFTSVSGRAERKIRDRRIVHISISKMYTITPLIHKMKRISVQLNDIESDIVSTPGSFVRTSGSDEKTFLG